MTQFFSPTSGLTERTWPSVILSPISVNGHVISVTSTVGLKVKMTVTLSKPGLTKQQFEIKRVFDSKTLMVGPIGKNIKKVSEAEAFDGGTLYAQEQSRNKLGDSPILRAVYEEEPTIAIRTIDVAPDGSLIGTPAAEISKIEPDSHFTYGVAYEPTSVRDYIPSKKVYQGNLTMSISGSSITLDALSGWMVNGAKFLAMDSTDTNNITILDEFEITSVSGTTLTVSPTPASNFSGIGRVDGSLGEAVKVTNFKYGSAFEIIKVYIGSSTVNADDIIRHIRET